MATRALPAPVAQLPNALTLARFVLVPLFVVLVLASDGGHSWPAAVVFGVAGVTDQVDGWLARRLDVESNFGRIADPLADRLMIEAAVILLFVVDRLPWAALVIVFARDAVLLLGLTLFRGRGIGVEVNFVGKVATWVLYASVGFVLVTHKQDDWPLWVFWIGIGIAVAAGGQYMYDTWKDIRR
jgi:CDP-diacylglycerol--glycerol-3-phosphate 3-phosphatidyltransferase